MAKKETTCSRTKQAWHAIDRMYNSEAARYGMTTTVGYILLNIDIREGTPSTSIGPMLGLEATSLVRTLDKLEKKKFILRRRDPLDARKVRIFLTRKGKDAREIARRTVKSFNEEVAAVVGEEKLKAFHEVIETIARFADEKTGSEKK